MKNLLIMVVLFCLCEAALASDGVDASECPRSLGFENVFSQPWPKASTWYGSEGLAVMLPENGIWPTTVPGHLIAVKLFWWSAGFAPGMESDLAVRIDRLDEGENDAVVSRATNAHAESLGGWTMLTGIHFPSPGCWRITGRYRDQELVFVVQTVHHSDYE